MEQQLERIAVAFERMAAAAERLAAAEERTSVSHVQYCLSGIAGNEADVSTQAVIRECRTAETETWKLRQQDIAESMEERRRRNAAIERAANGYHEVAKQAAGLMG